MKKINVKKILKIVGIVFVALIIIGLIIPTDDTDITDGDNDVVHEEQVDTEPVETSIKYIGTEDGIAYYEVDMRDTTFSRDEAANLILKCANDSHTPYQALDYCSVTITYNDDNEWVFYDPNTYGKLHFEDAIYRADGTTDRYDFQFEGKDFE